MLFDRADVKAGRFTANYPDDFVVFLIEMRVNELWRANAAAGELRELRGSSRMRDRVGTTDAH